jgi:4-hydroxyphenylpyruvate dioxygenase
MDRSRLSCTTVTFGGKLADKIRAMAAAGFGATEIWPRDFYEHNEGPDIALDLFTAHQMAPSCYQNLRNFEGMPEHLRTRKAQIATQLFDQMRLLGCQTLVLCSNIAPDSSSDTGRIVADLQMLGDLAAPFGVRVAWEPICWGRWVKDYREAWEIVRRVDHPCIGLVLDSFHVFALDLPVEAIADIPGEKIFLVEVADLPKVNLDFLEISRSFRLFPGEGATPIPAFIDQVMKTGYDGFYSVEVFNAYYQTLDIDIVARRAMQSLQGLLAGR